MIVDGRPAGRGTALAEPRPDRGEALVDALLPALRRLAPVALLDAGRGAGPRHLALLTGPRVRDDGRTVTVDGRPSRFPDDPFATLDALADEFGLGPDGPPPPPALLGAGFVGVLSYDLARRVEDLAGDSPQAAVDDLAAHALPLLDLTLSELAVTVTPDGATHVHADDRGSLPAGLVDLVRGVVHDTALAQDTATPRDRAARGGRTGVLVTSRTSRADHLRAVRRVLDHVAAGETFQVNLAQRLEATWTGDDHALYRALRAASPAPFGALVRHGQAAVASISPETFLVARGRDVVTRPIKGTRPRHADPVADRRAAADLQASPKDRAENVMVVDMERNDLGRVCRPGSVTVPDLLALEAHPTVWHLVSTVRGELRDGVGWGELLRATFPCGSVTGTPKVRAMQVIEALEPVRRHAYCGAIGHLGSGRLDLSVAIRSAVLLPDGRVHYGAGGGIVADSDPAAEHAETLDKAAAFVTAVGGVLAPDVVDGGA